jgi:NADPH:quinone reductase-like Zn-dependent oxidoreductase
MRAIMYQEYGTPDALELTDVEEPTPKENEVLVKVHAASVNSWDWDLLRGDFGNRLIFGGIRKPRLKILGCDVAGRVKAVGGKVRRFQTGDEVFGDVSGCGWGGFAEYVCIVEDVLAPKSASMTFEEAAAVPQAGVLALQGLRKKRRMEPGQKVLINGAGGGVGTFAIQIARSFGAEITGVDSGEKLDMMRSIGADRVIDYTQEDFTKTEERYDLILDVVGRRSMFDFRRALSPTGVYVMVGGAWARILQVLLAGPLLSTTGSRKIGLLLHRPSSEDLGVLNELFETGKLVPVIDRRYSLSEVPEALRYFGEGRVRGKLVVTLEEYL